MQWYRTPKPAVEQDAQYSWAVTVGEFGYIVTKFSSGNSIGRYTQTEKQIHSAFLNNFYEKGTADDVPGYIRPWFIKRIFFVNP